MLDAFALSAARSNLLSYAKPLRDIQAFSDACRLRECLLFCRPKRKNRPWMTKAVDDLAAKRLLYRCDQRVMRELVAGAGFEPAA